MTMSQMIIEIIYNDSINFKKMSLNDYIDYNKPKSLESSRNITPNKFSSI